MGGRGRENVTAPVREILQVKITHAIHTGCAFGLLCLYLVRVIPGGDISTKITMCQTQETSHAGEEGGGGRSGARKCNGKEKETLIG